MILYGKLVILGEGTTSVSNLQAGVGDVLPPRDGGGRQPSWTNCRELGLESNSLQVSSSFLLPRFTVVNSHQVAAVNELQDRSLPRDDVKKLAILK